MLEFGCCPRCGAEITNDRFIGGTIVCGCGWSKSVRSEATNRRNMDRTCASIVLIGGLLIASFLQAVNWDKYFFTIIPLKAKQVVGVASLNDLEQIAQICQERKKHECVEKSYVSISRLEPGNLTNLLRLGELQYKRQRFALAIETFGRYFQNKGDSAEAAFLYAQSLAHEKKYSEAGQFYRFALSKKDTVMPVTYVRSYVQMLVEAQKLQQAKSTILAYRKRSNSANLFMNKELTEIRTRLGEVQTALAKGV